MVYIDITSDIDAATGEVARFFRKQMRYVMMRSINDTAGDVQKQLELSTLPKATPRNKALPKAMTRFIPDEKSGTPGRFTTQNFLTSKDTITIGPAVSKTGYLAGEGFVERQVTGVRKVPKTSAVAIPVIGPGLRRGAGGSIPAAKKAKNLRGNERFFKTKSKTGGAQLIFERMGADGERLRLRHILLNSAAGTKQYAAFYPDAFAAVDRVFSGHFEREMNKAIANSRFA